MGRHQDPQHPGFVGLDDRYDCRACISWHARQFDFADLEPENVTAWSLYQRVEDQVRVGMDVIGLDYTVLPTVFELYGIPREDWRLMFEKIAEISRAQQQERAIARATEQSKRAEAVTQRAING